MFRLCKQRPSKPPLVYTGGGNAKSIREILSPVSVLESQALQLLHQLPEFFLLFRLAAWFALKVGSPFRHLRKSFLLVTPLQDRIACVNAFRGRGAYSVTTRCYE
jgi:hypothetical protein